MAEPKINTITTTTPIEGVDSGDTSISVGSLAPLKQNTLKNCRHGPSMVLGI